jgi:hypothetical protein
MPVLSAFFAKSLAPLLHLFPQFPFNLTIMTERFKKEFDYNERVMEAACLAASLGYEEGYYGNLMCENVDYCNRLRAAIRRLVGN